MKMTTIQQLAANQHPDAHTKTVHVWPSQIKAARLQVEINEEAGVTSRPGLLALAGLELPGEPPPRLVKGQQLPILVPLLGDFADVDLGVDSRNKRNNLKS